MSAHRSLLVLVEPALIDSVARYLEHPRKRESIALQLAARAPDSAGKRERTLQRATGISARLDGAVRLRDRALESGSEDDGAEYGRRIWSELALLAATTRPSWGEGIGRTFGLLAYPERFMNESELKPVRHLSRALRHLLTSTADLAPALALPGCHSALPAWGGEGLASSCVRADFTAWLALLLSGERWPLQPLATEMFGERAATAWRDNARRAARAADRNGAHLLEVDMRALRAQCSDRPPARRHSASMRATWAGALETRVA